MTVDVDRHRHLAETMTEDDLRRRFSILRRLHLHASGPRTAWNPDETLRIDELERLLLDALRRDRGPGPGPDGYPGGQQGSGGEDAAQSSTEAAALARLLRDQPDNHHDLTIDALAAIIGMTELYLTVERRVVAIAALAQHPRPSTLTGGTCIICGRHVAGGYKDPMRRGMCNKDRTAYDRAGRPELVPVFIEDRHGELVPAVADDGVTTLFTWSDRQSA